MSFQVPMEEPRRDISHPHRITIEFGHFEQNEEVFEEGKIIIVADDFILGRQLVDPIQVDMFTGLQDGTVAGPFIVLMWISNFIWMTIDRMQQTDHKDPVLKGVFDIMGEYIDRHIRKILKFKSANNNGKANPFKFGFSKN